MVRHVQLVAVVGLLMVGGVGAGRPDVAQPRDAVAATVASQRSGGALIERDGITASKTVQAVLDRAREAVGGRARLSAVRSLLIDWTLIFEGQRPNPRQWRMLVPNRFAEIRAQMVYVIDGANYYQAPEPAKDAKEDARKAMTTTFTEQSLVLLLRAPSLEPVRAELKDTAAGADREVVFTRPDGSALGIDLDASTCRPKAYYRFSSVTMNGKTTTGTRRVVIDDANQVSGIWFPKAMTILQEGFPTPVKMAFTAIRVNEGVTAEDFRSR